MSRRARKSPAPADVVTPFDLIGAPELAALAMLEAAIHFTRIALLAQHAELLMEDEFLARGELRPGADIAARFLHRAHEMYVVIRDYRAAIAHAAKREESDDPF